MEFPKDTVAMFRLPIQLEQMTAICNLFRDCLVHQDEEWLIFTRRTKS